MTDKIFEIVTTLIGGGLLGAILTYLLGSKKVDVAKDTSDREQLLNEFKILLAERKEITDKLIEENSKLVEKLQKRIIYLEHEIKDLKDKLDVEYKQVNTLRNQLILFESSHADIPLPMWMKDTSGKMVFLNKIYEEVFLIPRGYTIDDYVGYTDEAVWSKEIAKAFGKHDQKVMRTKKHVRTVEYILDKNDNKIAVEILKYPRMINNKVIGISGIVLGMDLTPVQIEALVKKIK